jgi:hypothetical protein
MPQDKDWREFERLVARIEAVLAPRGAVVRSPDRLPDLLTGSLREVDASIRFTVGSAEILITVECRRRDAVQDDTWIEQLATKKEKLGAARTIAVSASGFSAPASVTARLKGIDLRNLRAITDEKIVGWLRSIELTTFGLHVSLRKMKATLEGDPGTAQYEFEPESPTGGIRGLVRRADKQFVSPFEVLKLGVRSSPAFLRGLPPDSTRQTRLLQVGLPPGALQAQTRAGLRSIAFMSFDLECWHELTTESGPYQARITAAPPLSVGLTFPLQSEPFVISQWVNERTYSRSRTNQSGGWIDDATRVSRDWLEMRVFDYLADAPAVPSEAEDVLARPIAIKDGWQLGSKPAQVPPGPGPDTDNTIEINPKFPFWRYTVPNQALAQIYYHGLRTDYQVDKAFAITIAHEARHTWVFTLKAFGQVIDSDDDKLPANPPASAAELRDAAYPTNTEFNFRGDQDDQTKDWQFPSWLTAQEHNAVRFAGPHVGGVVSCASIAMSPPTYTVTPPQLQTALSFLDGTGANAPLQGTLVDIERAPAGTDCEAGSGWTHESYVDSSTSGGVSYTPTSTGIYRISIIPPPECNTIRRCVPVP